MAKSLQQWLGLFIATELASVTEWKRECQRAPKVKLDPESRFSDDGSNFRSAAGSPPLSTESKVQLVKILSTKDPAATALVSDGANTIKATLSRESVTVLEEELEEELSLDMRGDVVSLAAVTVISTPYGPADGHIQLVIDELQYQYHLRKTIGDPAPIEQHKEVARLLVDITKLRRKQYADGESFEEAEPISSHIPPDAVPGASRLDSRNPRQHTPLAASQRNAPSQASSPVVVSASPQSQAALATQVPARKKPTGPSLAREGFAIEGGVNLSRPSAPNLASTKQRAPSAPNTHAPAVSTNTTLLLNLLGKPKDTTPDRSAVPDVTEVEPEAEPSDPEQPPPASQVEQSFEVHGQKDTSRVTAKRPVTPAVTGIGPRIKRTRRKIPREQQRLLEQKSSWYPSDPGRRFPHPNVPVELLQTWNTEVPAHATYVSQQSSHGRDEHDVAQESSASSSTDDAMELSESSSDEGLPWASTPSQPKRDMLPPDSTTESVPPPIPRNSQQSMTFHSPSKPPSLPPDSPFGSSRGTPRFASTQQLPLRSPVKQHSLPPRPPPSTARASDQYSPSSSMKRGNEPPSRRSEYARRESRNSAYDSYAPSYPGGSRNSRPTSRDHELARRGSRDAAYPESSMPRKEFDHYAPPYSSTSRDTRALPRDRDYERTGKPEPTHREADVPLPRHRHQDTAHPRSSGLDTVIKGTQFANTGEEMEMDVPRPLEDSAVTHRQIRSETLKVAQRCAWLNTNYVLSSESRPYLSQVHEAYLAAHPQDQVALTHFKQAMKQSFPSLLGGYPPQSLMRKRAGTNVASSSRPKPNAVRPPASHTLDGAYETDLAAAADAVGGRLEAEQGKRKPERTATDGDISTPVVVFEDPQPSTAANQGGPPMRGSQANGVTHSTQQNSQTSLLKQHQAAPKADRMESQRRASGTQDTAQMPTTAFSEFVHGWTHLGPGGAFAKPQSASRTPRAVAQGVDVLAWDI